MPYHPVSQLALARARQQDLLDEAARHRLARTARADEAGLRNGVVAFLRRRKTSRRAGPRVASAPK